METKNILSSYAQIEGTLKILKIEKRNQLSKLVMVFKKQRKVLRPKIL
jgi:hypothetical protein